ncbi:hypothetical protein Zmor_020462 [Zophobas morio]|uniref:Ribosome-binding protein 1 n=1 Tax=Zophobas morio TaxID=2755281 RepID=A0AA38I3M1_9CUCU|nr:hypothetical protein Zmor_020462 [Zophobas morio]
MDIQIPFIFVSLFSLASVVLIFIYKFGIKEKSYEEALAEQRQQTHILLGIKPKLKEKKSKKLSKKVQSVPKEKSPQETEVVKEVVEQVESNQKNVDSQKKPHVEFKEDTEDVSTKTVVNKKQPKKDKVRPILINKENSENDVEKLVNTDSVTCPANHFEELHPKDDFELFRSISGEETVKEETEKTVSSADVTSQKQNSKKQPERDPPPAPKEEAPSTIPPTVNSVVPNVGKEKKKKKSELNTIQQLAGDTNGPNMSILLNLVRKAELSRSEVQILIDLLLNKQHEAPAVIDEWSEGKSDPVQKLKKQLAEKEKLLAEEQQAVANAQAKLKELRSEHQNEKSTLLQKIRSMEELMHSKQLDANRNHQQIQQLQAQVKEEVIKYHTLREEHAALQMQRQQIEMRLNQAQESEVIISQLQGEVQELSSINNQLQMELAHFTEENMGEKERNQSLILQLNSFQKELEQKSDRNRQLEESRVKVEHDVETILNRENDLKAEVSHLNSVIQQQNEEIRKLEHNLKQHLDDLQKQTDDSNKIITQLTSDLRQAQEETAQMKVTHMNGALQENKQHEVELLGLHDELVSVKIQKEKELKTATALTEKLEKEIEELKLKFNEEKIKLEEQKSKNNELRQRNWKVMEALNAAECRIKTSAPNAKTKSEQDIEREFIQRLFPELKDEEINNPELFKTKGETFIRNYLSNLRQESSKSDDDQDAQQLKVQLQHYENVIDSTEKMLNKLQKHIEQEEINWRMQLSAKADELEAVKERHKQELHEKLSRLEVELKKEQEDKKRVIAEFQQCNSNGHTQISSSEH